MCNLGDMQRKCLGKCEFRKRSVNLAEDLRRKLALTAC